MVEKSKWYLYNNNVTNLRGMTKMKKDEPIVIAQIMGFDPKKIKYIENGYKLKELKISADNKFNVYNENGLVKDMKKYNKHFKATDGWKDYL